MISMPLQQQRRFPTLQSPSCSPQNIFCDSTSREEEMFSPPTLPYTFESLVQNMNRGRQISTESVKGSPCSCGSVKGSPNSTGSAGSNIFQGSPVSPLNGDNSKGSQSNGAKVSPGTSPSGNSPGCAPKPSAGNRKPPKLGLNLLCTGSYGHASIRGTSDNVATVAAEDVIRWKEFRRRQKELQPEKCIDQSQTEPLNLDSLSLSASNFSLEDKKGQNKQKPTSPKEEDAIQVSQKAIEIDQDGFPASSASTDDISSARQSLTSENVECMTSSISEAPTEIASNTLFSRLLASSGARGARGELGSICETRPSDAAPTQPTSNSTVTKAKVRDLRVRTSPTSVPSPMETSGPRSTRSASSIMSTQSDTSARERFGDKRKYYSTENEWDDTKPTLDVDALNDSSLDHPEPSVEEKEVNPNDVSMVSSNWDPLHVTTVEEGDELSCNGNDASVSSFNIHGDMGVDDDNSFKVEETGVPAQNPCEESPPKSLPDPSPTSSSSNQSSSASSKDRASSPISCCSVPTLKDVKSFMNKLDSLREESRVQHAANNKPDTVTNARRTESPPKQKQSLPPLRDSPPGVEIKEENVDYLRSLLEKKEKLRLHKLESQRKRNELDERLKAMRCRVYGDDNNTRSGLSTSVEARDGEVSTLVEEEFEAKDDAVPSEDKSFVVMSESKAKDASSLSMMPGARWSGGRAIWSSPVSSPVTLSVDKKEKEEADGGHTRQASTILPTIATDEAERASNSHSKLPAQKVVNNAMSQGTKSGSRPLPNSSSNAASGLSINAPINPPDEAADATRTYVTFGKSLRQSPSSKSPSFKAARYVTSTNTNREVLPSSCQSQKSSTQQPPLPIADANSGPPSLNVTSTSSTLSIALDKDDFSFKPSLLTRKIPFSPLVAGSKTTGSKFSFSSPDINRSTASVFSSDNDKKSPTLEAMKTSPCSPPETSPAMSSTSPDVSEGDKGGGLGFGYIFGDKSVVSKSSSKFVELGQFDTSPKKCKAEEQSLLGVTVLGSKEKKHVKKRPHSPQFETVDEQSMASNQGNEAVLKEEDSRIVAPDPPGVESSNASNDDNVEPSNATANDAPKQDSTKKQPGLSIKPPPLSPVVESSTDYDFESVMQRVKIISNTPRSCLETPRVTNSASLKSPRFRMERENKVTKVNATIDALKAKFESEGHKVSPTPKMKDSSRLIPTDNSISQCGWTKPRQAAPKPFESSKVWSLMVKESNQLTEADMSRKEFYEQTKPTTGFLDLSRPKAVLEPKNHAAIAPNLSGVKEELEPVDSLDNSSTSSFKGLNIKELRLRFEGSKDSLSVGSVKKFDSLKSRESGTKNSFDSDIDDNDCTDGENSLDTKKVLSYAKKIEQRVKKRYSAVDSRPEVATTIEAGSGETENSSKENIVDKAADDGFPHFSPVAIRKKAFEMRKREVLQTAVKPPENDGGSLKDVVLICHKVNPTSEQLEVPPAKAATPKQMGTPRLSVRERVATFSNPGAYNQTVAMLKNPLASPRQVVPFQKLTPPPRTIDMNRANQTPSPLWTHNKEDDINSPMANLSSPIRQHGQRHRQSAPFAMGQTTYGTRNSANQNYPYDKTSQQAVLGNQARTIQTTYNSTGPTQGDDDYDDGITLSPTCSEVSGLTLPTCLASLADDNSRTMRQSSSSEVPDFQEAMSPIARHRQKNGANLNGNLFNHPYLKRMIAQNLPNCATPTARGQHQEQHSSSQVKQKPSHREQILSRVIEKPGTPRKSQPSANKKTIPHPQRKKSMNSSTQPTLASSRAINDQSTQKALPSPQHRKQSHRKEVVKGKVAERVAMVNELTNRTNEASIHQHIGDTVSKNLKEAKARHKSQRSEEQSSAATRDCVRVN
eukprot:CCRYP_000379-RA/>CCRYP_000379-RA protein AED:0.01 eAED:0.01 QI:381/1/1/1/0/0/2/57/1854